MNITTIQNTPVEMLIHGLNPRDVAALIPNSQIGADVICLTRPISRAEFDAIMEESRSYPGATALVDAIEKAHRKLLLLLDQDALVQWIGQVIDHNDWSPVLRRAARDDLVDAIWRLAHDLGEAGADRISVACGIYASTQLHSERCFDDAWKLYCAVRMVDTFRIAQCTGRIATLMRQPRAQEIVMHGTTFSQLCIQTLASFPARDFEDAYLVGLSDPVTGVHALQALVALDAANASRVWDVVAVVGRDASDIGRMQAAFEIAVRSFPESSVAVAMLRAMLRRVGKLPRPIRLRAALAMYRAFVGGHPQLTISVQGISVTPSHQVAALRGGAICIVATEEGKDPAYVPVPSWLSEGIVIEYARQMAEAASAART